MRTVTSRLSALLLTLALVAGCSSQPSGVAATVDGTDIPRAELEAAVRELTGDGLDELDAADRAELVEQTQHQLLTIMIQTEIIEVAAARRGVEVDPDEVRGMVEEQTDAVGGREQLADILAGQSLTMDLFLNRLVPTQARLDQIRAQLLADLDDVVLRTTRHILVDTLDEAESLLEDLEAGADFAALAAMHSTDVGSGAAGGDLGPALPGSYVPAFEEAVWSASLNELVGPIETNFGFHLLEVTAEQTTPAQELDSRLAEQILGNDLDEVLRAVQSEVEITVAPGLGVWDPVQGRVVAG